MYALPDSFLVYRSVLLVKWPLILCADSLCLAAMPRQPAHSKEIYTQINFITDSVQQLFICDLGYSTTNGEGEAFLVHTRCERGLWSPEKTIDCTASELYLLYISVLPHWQSYQWFQLSVDLYKFGIFLLPLCLSISSMWRSLLSCWIDTISSTSTRTFGLVFRSAV